MYIYIYIILYYIILYIYIYTYIDVYILIYIYKIDEQNMLKQRKLKKKKQKSTLPPFALFGLSCRYGFPFVNIFLVSYCCRFT